MKRSGIDPVAIDDVIMGCVDQAGEQSCNIARMCVLASDLPQSCPATSIDRQCGSSQQAVHFAAQAVMSGTMDAVIACGVESMTRVPMGLPFSLPQKNGFGTYMSPVIQQKYGSAEFSQFVGAQMMANKYGISREDMDQFSLVSHQRAVEATTKGYFRDEIVPLTAISFNPKTGVTENLNKEHVVDEGIRFDATYASISSVKPLQEGGVITAANASQICDGASGVLIVNEKALKTYNLKPLARIHHMSVVAGNPVIMLENPLEGTMKALSKSGMALHDIDLFEINEAFASVALSWLKYTGADPSKLNVHGGAIALGHPLGASGTKLMTTLMYALKTHKKKYGLQSMCEGGGMANMTIIENLH